MVNYITFNKFNITVYEKKKPGNKSDRVRHTLVIKVIVRVTRSMLRTWVQAERTAEQIIVGRRERTEILCYSLKVDNYHFNAESHDLNIEVKM